MIAELFYPKELKQLIADLRAKDDLNEEAVAEINKSIRTPLLLGAILLIALIYGSNGWYFYASLFLAVLAGCFFAVRSTINNLVVPYTFGNPVQGEVEDIRFGKDFDPNRPKAWRFYYSFMGNQGELIKKRFIVLPENMVNPPWKEGDVIIVLVDPKNTRSHAPFLPTYFKKLCLSKSRMRTQLEKGS